MTEESSTRRRLGSALTKKERKDGLSLFRNLKILCPAGCLIRFRSLSLVSLRLFLQPSDFLSLALLFECEKFSSASLEGSNKVSVYLREIFNIVKQIISCLHGNEIFLDLLKTMQQTYMFTFETLFFFWRKLSRKSLPEIISLHSHLWSWYGSIRQQRDFVARFLTESFICRFSKLFREFMKMKPQSLRRSQFY